MSISTRVAKMERTLDARQCPRCYNMGPTLFFVDGVQQPPIHPDLPCAVCGRPIRKICIVYPGMPPEGRKAAVRLNEGTNV